VWLSSRKRARSPYPNKSAFYFPNSQQSSKNKTTTFRRGVDLKGKLFADFLHIKKECGADELEGVADAVCLEVDLL
jgi:hypothetical protein